MHSELTDIDEAFPDIRNWGMFSGEIEEYIADEIGRLFPPYWQEARIIAWDIDPIKGFTMIALQDTTGRIYRGYAKRCNYAPCADRHSDKIGLSVALSHIMSRYNITRK